MEKLITKKKKYIFYFLILFAAISGQETFAANAGRDTTICSGTAVSIGSTAFANHFYTWSSNPMGFSSTAANPIVYPIITTTYILKDSMAGNLPDYDTVIISVNKLPVAAAYNHWMKIDAGNGFTIAIKADGTLWTWGENIYGNLGDGTYKNRSYPQQIGQGSTWIYISAGESFCLAIKNDGTLWSWGNNNSGQLGDGTTTIRNIPVQIGKANDWKSVTGYSKHCLAIKTDGTLWAWGDNSNGKLGNGTIVNKTTPIKISGYSDWKCVSAGTQHTLAIRTNGTLWAWGDNSLGQLGDASNTTKYTPTQIGVKNDWDSLSAGDFHSIAIKTNGTLWVCGRNNYGQLGNGTTNDVNVFTQIGLASDWQKVSAGRYYSSGIKTDGTLWLWGYNLFGQIGDGTLSNKNIPTQIGNMIHWKLIAIDFAHSLALANDGSYWAWGFNGSGEFGDSSKTHSNIPKIITNTPAVCENDTFLLGLPSKPGFVYTWGSIPFGFNSSASQPRVAISMETKFYVKVTSLFCPGEDIDSGIIRMNYIPRPNAGMDTLICVGSQITLGGVSNNNSKYLWTSNPVGFYSSLSNPIISATLSTTTYYLKESFITGCINYDTVIVKVPTAQVNVKWRSTSCGANHNAAIKTDGTLWAWGQNLNGEIGDGTNIDKAFPTQVGKDTDWLEVRSGYRFTVALKTNGTLWSWGDNGGGQLGIGTNTSSSIPVQVGIDNDWVKFEVGDVHVLAIKNNGTLWAWGANVMGQIGDGTSFNRSKPIRIGNDVNWASISTGTEFSLALKKNGTLWSWGDNFAGQLGSGNTTKNYIPTMVGSDSDWVSISGGYIHSSAIKKNGTLWAWGDNAAGQLAQGNFTNSKIPIQVGNDNTWTDLSCSRSSYTLALKSDGTFWGWGNNGFGYLGDSTTNSMNIPTQVRKDIGWGKLGKQGGFCSFVIKADGTMWGCGANFNFVLGNGNKNHTIKPIKIGDNNFKCIGNPITLGQPAISGFNYSWKSIPAGISSSSAQIQVSPTYTTTYYLTVTANGCTAIDSGTFTIDTITTTDAGKDTTICFGSMATIKTPMRNGHYYRWISMPAGFSSTSPVNNVSPTLTTSYILIDSSINSNCFATDTMVVTVNSLPKVNAGFDQVTCIGGDLSIGTANITGHSYSWSSIPSGFISSIAQPIISPKSSKLYILRDSILSTGCTTFDSVYITVNPLPVINAGKDQTICEGIGFAVIGSAPIVGDSYSWSSIPQGYKSVSAMDQVYPKVTTTYILKDSINATGCTAIDSVTIIVNPAPNIQAGNDKAICIGSFTNIGSSPINGHTYNWSSFPIGYYSQKANDSVSPTLKTVYILKDSINATGCFAFDSVTISVNPLPSKPSISQNINTLNSSATIGNQWYLDGNIISGATNQNYNASVDGKYKVTVSDSNSCMNISDDYNFIYTKNGIEKINRTIDVSAFPNPFDQTTTINYSLKEPSNVDISIVDITGKEVYKTHQVKAASGVYLFIFSPENATGIYFLKIYTDNEWMSLPLIQMR